MRLCFSRRCNLLKVIIRYTTRVTIEYGWACDGQWFHKFLQIKPSKITTLHALFLYNFQWDPWMKLFTSCSTYEHSENSQPSHFIVSKKTSTEHTFLIQILFASQQYSFGHFSAASSVVHLSVRLPLLPRPPQALGVDEDWKGWCLTPSVPLWASYHHRCCLAPLADI